MKEKSKKCCKKVPLEFYIQNYKIIFIFLFPIFGVIYNRIRYIFLNGKNNIFFSLELYFISYLFSFIPFIIYIIKYRTKKERAKNDDIINEGEKEIDIISLEISKKEKKHKLKGFLIIILLCSTSLAFRYLDYQDNIDKKTIGLVYKIPFLFILSFFVLKYKLYKHHFIALGINLLSLLIKYIVGIIQSEKQKLIKRHLWFFLLFAISHSLFLISGKYFFDKYNITPYLLMLIIGSINSFILIVIAIIKYLITSESDIFKGFNNYITSFPTFLIFMADIISQFIYNLGSWITVYYFTPLHTIISENIIEIYYFICDIKYNLNFWEERNYKWNIWFIPTVYAFNLICSLIFNEIIILRCCNLDYYTRVRIDEREATDSEAVLKFMENSSDTDSSNKNSIIDEDSIN